MSMTVAEAEKFIGDILCGTLEETVIIPELKKDNITVRPILIQDMSDVAELDEMSGNYVFEMLEDYEEDEFGSYAYGIFVDDELVGYCTVGGAEPYHELKEYQSLDLCLSDVYIKEEYRGNGYGRLLVEKAIEFEIDNETKPVHIFATLLNDYLIEFYEPLGFKVIYPNEGIIYK